jgi:hypothetical protein
MLFSLVVFMLPHLVYGEIIIQGILVDGDVGQVQLIIPIETINVTNETYEMPHMVGSQVY